MTARKKRRPGTPGEGEADVAKESAPSPNEAEEPKEPEYEPQAEKEPRPEEEPRAEEEPQAEEESDESSPDERGPSLWTRARPFAVIASTAYLLIAAIWILTGSMTNGPQMCTGCHAHSAHEQAGATDPHFGVPCVNCHEPGGWVARYTSNVPMRLQHFFEAQSGSVRSQPFGQKVSSAGCAECHAKDMRQTLYDPTRAVSMSHKEPLEAGAECMDCHRFKSGEISAGTWGMASCVRCHDGKTADAKCGKCHQGDPTDNRLSQISPEKMSSRLVPVPDCKSCHASSASCRRCHGTTWPRPVE